MAALHRRRYRVQEQDQTHTGGSHSPTARVALPRGLTSAEDVPAANFVARCVRDGGTGGQNRRLHHQQRPSPGQLFLEREAELLPHPLHGRPAVHACVRHTSLWPLCSAAVMPMLAIYRSVVESVLTVREQYKGC